MRIAPGIVHVGRSPLVLGVRPLAGVENVWEALIDDQDGDEPRVILTMGPKVIRFVERYCIFTQARWTGQPVRLLPWQKNLTVELFEVAWDDDRGRYVRRYHEALLGIPKKQGKSDWLGALGLYFFAGDGEPTPVIVAAGANETSAKLVFTPMKTMVEVPGADDWALNDVCDAFDSQIFLRGVPNAEIRKVPASPKATEGLNIFVNLMDEWHEWTSPAAVQTSTKLMNGTVLRPDYMNIRTTTAGHDLKSLCGEDYEFGKAVAAGDVEAPEWFFRWYEAPREIERAGKVTVVDWQSEEAVALANPSYGPLSKWPYYRDKLRRLKKNLYCRYFLNWWPDDGEDSWLPPGSWEACEDRKLELAPGWPTCIGWDAATHNDSTALFVAQAQDTPAPERPRRVVVAAWIWERPLDPETRKPKEGWTLPIEEVVAKLLELIALYHPSSVEYDPAFITWEAGKLKEAGHPMREFSQSSVLKLSQGSQAFFELVINGIIAHRVDRYSAFSRHIRSAVARQTASGSAAWLLTKGKARKKMDAAVAGAMAIWGLEHPMAAATPSRGISVYIPDDDD